MVAFSNKILIRSGAAVLVLVFVFHTPEVTLRKLAIVDKTTLKDVYHHDSTPPTQTDQKEGNMTRTIAPDLEDIDQAIFEANLEERTSSNQKVQKSSSRRQERQQRKREKKLSKQEKAEEKFQRINQHPLVPEDLPPLDSLIGGLHENITGNVQSLLDFAIVGFGKCGTTALIDWLDGHPEVNTIPKEALHLAKKRPALMVQKLYEMKVDSLAKNNAQQPEEQQMGRLQGFKNPSDVRRPESMAYLRQHWPQTKLIITLRHPMHWFTSLYNFLLNEMGRKTKFLQHTSLIGGPHKNTKYAHTGKGEFHAILSLLGKTNMTEDAELDLLKGFLQEDEILNWPQPLPNPIFLLETTQMSDPNKTRAALFRKDLQDFLGLHQELPEVPHVRPRAASAKKNLDGSLKMDLCKPENQAIRQELMRISHKASLWLRQFFLKSPDVVVSSREYLEEIFATSWMQDPCSDTNPKKEKGGTSTRKAKMKKKQS